jgi:hypothetical protein
VNATLSQVARRLEVRQRRRYRAGAITVTGGPEDLVVVGAERVTGSRGGRSPG